MSIKTTNTIDVEVDTTEVATSSSNDIVNSNQHTLHVRNLDSIVSGTKKEYSIVGDGFYASVGTDQAPEWLTSIIDSVVEESVRSGFVDYNELVGEVRSAIDSIDIAENTYVKTINFDSLVDGRLGTVVDTLNARVDNVESTIVDIDTVQSTADSAVASRISDIRAEFNGNESRITGLEIAYAAADQILANSINSLSGRLDSQDGTLSGTADSIQGLKTYVGLDEYNDPNSTGMLARVQVLENQNDGVIEYTTGTYDVMVGVSPGDSNIDDDELDVTQEPYATWIAADTTNTNEAERSAHVGDVYIQYDVTTGNYVKSYKFIKTAQDTTSPFATDPQGYTWALITDTDSQSAYVAALNAADLADQKRRVFVAVPFAPYDEGDLWVDNSTSPSVVKVATTARANTYNAGDWAVADEQAQYFIDNTYTPDSAAIHRQLDGKIEYQFFDTHEDVTHTVEDVEVAATSESNALDIIESVWTTQALKDSANGNVVYFKDTTTAYWYQASTPAWKTITDTSIYEALQDAATAQGAADGKVSQFYAWGGAAAPADYDIVVEPAYTDEDDNEVAAVTTTVSADNFLYWYKTDGILYYKPLTEWTAVPITAGTGNVYVAEGDIVTVFDPTDGDISNYSYNGTTWQRTGPTGIISQSSYFLDLDTAVRGPNGVAQGLVDLRIDSEAYTDDEVTGVVNNFKYDSVIFINGYYYKTGFGLVTTGTLDHSITGADGETEAAAFDSEFYVNAKRFVLENPDHPDVKATFTVTDTGITLGVEHTEATRNIPKGAYTASEDYVLGDMITYNGSSYVALKSFSDIAPDTPQVTDPLDTDYPYWQLLADKGTSPDALTVTPSYNAETGVTTLSFSDGSSAAISDGTNADALTVSASTVNGITTLSFSDGTSATVNDGTSSGVKVIYADDANGTNATFTNSSQAYVNYYEWTETVPTEVPTGLTYTKIVGEDGDAQGVKPIYADDTTGTNATFTFSNQEFVNFYEWSTAAPTLVPPSLTYVRFKGEERGVKVIYADDAAGTSASFTDSSKTYVNYYEWVGVEPTEIPNGLTYVKFKGENGDSEGVISIYADDANGTNATLVFNNQKFVNFYEWTNSPPTVAPEGLTYVKFVGTDADTYKEIFIYANSINAPTLPTSTAGYFNTSTGVVATPAEETTWSTSASTPSSGKSTWRSSLTIVDENSDGSWAASDTAWNAPVKLTGDEGTGIRGTATLTHNASDLGAAEPGDESTIAKIASYWDTAAPADYAGEIAGDTLILNNTDTAAGWTHIYKYSEGAWVATSTFTVNGNQVINGTLAAEAIGSGSFRSTAFGNPDERPPRSEGYTGTIMDTAGISVYNNGILRVRLGDLSKD